LASVRVRVFRYYPLDSHLSQLCPMILSYIQDGCHAMIFVWLKNRKSLKIFRTTGWKETKFDFFQDCTHWPSTLPQMTMQLLDLQQYLSGHIFSIQLSLYDLSIVTVSHVGLLTGSLDTILKVDSLSKEDSS
jgi:hypothetical protein